MNIDELVANSKNQMHQIIDDYDGKNGDKVIEGVQSKIEFINTILDPRFKLDQQVESKIKEKGFIGVIKLIEGSLITVENDEGRQERIQKDGLRVVG